MIEDNHPGSTLDDSKQPPKSAYVVLNDLLRMNMDGYTIVTNFTIQVDLIKNTKEFRIILTK